MFQWFGQLFDTSGFPPRWNCGAGWAETPSLGWLHIVSDVCVFVAYYAVPCIVLWHLLRVPDVRNKFPKLFWIFLALVFFSCGTVHLIEAGIFWWPHYRLSALFKVLTAMVSLIGVVVLARSLPRALELKTPEQLHREIEVRRRAETRLELEQSLLSRLMDHLPDLIYFKDTSGKYLRVSRSLADKLKVDDIADVLGKSESDYFEDGAGHESDDKQVLASGEAIIGRIEKAPWTNHDEIWLSTSRLPLQGSNDEVLGTFGISHDITAIMQSEEKLALLARKLAVPREGEAANRPPLKLSQFSLQDMITCGSDIRGMGLKAESRAALERDVVEYLYRRIRNDEGEPAFALVRMFKTNTLKQLDGELQRLAIKSSGGAELKPDTRCLVLRGTVGLEPSWNDPDRSKGHRVIPLPSVPEVEQLPMIAQLIRQLGLDVGGVLIGKSELMMDSSETSVFHVAHARGSEFIPAQEEFVVPYGIESVVGFGDLLPSGDLFAVIGFSRVPIDDQAAQFFSHLSISAKLALLALEPPGEQVEAQIQAVDTLLQNYERVVCDQEAILRETMLDLKRARDSADAANLAKSEFLANMSHEIRTPMNAILGMTELVLEGNVSATEREYLSTVLESGESLLNIINEILDFSKIEAGRLDLDESEFDLREEIGDMLRSLAIRAHRKNIELAWEVASDVPTCVRADLARLRQVIVNLTGNAIKFTTHGEVVVRIDTEHVDHQSAKPEFAELRFSVTDTGIGIPEEKRNNIFEAFSQADASTTRVHGGTGLGLAISARIVQAMGGRIEVESEIDRGSRFSFKLAVPICDPESQPRRRSTQTLRGTSVLLVDDNATNLTILEKIVTSWGMEPIAVHTAAEALEVLEAWDATSNPLPTVITDVQMPETDGYMLVERIRANAAISDAVVIVLTSGSRPEDVAKCRELGIAAHITKPAKPSDLLSALLRRGDPSSEHEAASHVDRHLTPEDAAGSPIERPLRVLLVEDGIANQKLAKGMLERWGHTVEIAENGAVGVEMYQRKQFDLILMDVQMPVMDGLEATVRIREIESSRDTRIPIIAMTAHALVGDRERCLESGMDEYVSKPIRKQLLAETIQSFFGGTDSVTTSPDAPSSAGQIGTDSIDMTAALETMEGDHEILHAVVQAFVDEAPTLLQLLDDGMETGNEKDVTRAAHTLKGNFRILRLTEHEQRWGVVEELAWNGRFEEIGDAIERARGITESAIDELHRFLESTSR